MNPTGTNKLNFSRFKKKTLILLYNMFAIDNFFYTNKIRNKKLSQCIFRIALSQTFNELILKEHNSYISCLILINVHTIASGSNDRQIKFRIC